MRCQSRACRSVTTADGYGLAKTVTVAPTARKETDSHIIETFQSSVSFLMSSPVNQATIDLIKHFEGFRSNAYLCPANVWTIGYGSTRGVKRGDRITEAAASARLLKEVTEFAAGVDRLVKVPLTDNQRGAVVSFAYNVGTGALSRSTLLKKLNQGDFTGASAEFLRWNKANGRVLAGLTRRRAAEQALFNRI